MILTTFKELEVGARFRAFSVRGWAVYTKTNDEAGLDEFREPIVNASSQSRGLGMFALRQPVVSLTDEEVIEAKEIEQYVKFGSELKKSFLLSETGELYVKVRAVEQQPARREGHEVFE